MRSVLVAYVAAAASLVTSCSSSTSTTTAPKDAGASTGGAVSYANDVFPIFLANCALTACHGSKQSNLGIYISNDRTQVYGELEQTSAVSQMKFVVPGDSKNSWLMLKMDGQQSTAKCGTACGTEMPPDAMLDQATRDVVRKWIDEGAKQN